MNDTHLDDHQCPICKHPIDTDDKCVYVMVLPFRKNMKKRVHESCYKKMSDSLKYNF